MKTKTTKKAKITTGPSSTPTKGIAEVDFGASIKTSKGKYPIIADATAMADEVLRLAEKYDAVADPYKAAKETLRDHAFPQFFAANHGRIDAGSSMVAYGSDIKDDDDKVIEPGRGVRVTFKDQYTPGDKKLLYALLTPEVAGIWFKQCWEVTINGNVIPEDKAAGLIDDIKKVMVKHGCEHAFGVKAQILPRPNFNLQRHARFDETTLIEIQKIVPQHASVSTKGVK